MTKALVVYYTHSGNTRTIAECIARKTGATVAEIVPVKAYPTDYNAVVNQAKREIQAGVAPDLAKDADTDAYDVVFVGTPNWWSTMAPPIKTFLANHDFAGKTVVPFCTHGGGGGGHIERDIKAGCPGADVKAALVVSGDGGNGLESLVDAWLRDSDVSS